MCVTVDNNITIEENRFGVEPEITAKISKIRPRLRIYEVGISYHGRNGPMKHMNNIAKCALTNINVVYGGDRFSVFDDSAPVQVDLTLQFKEVQLLSQSDMDAVPGAGY